MPTVRYIVADVPAAVAFYTAHLGFTVTQHFGPAMAILHREGLDLWLAGPKASASQPMPDGRRPVPGGRNRFVVDVADLDAMVLALRAAGVDVLNDVVTGPGGKQVLLADPSGNVVEVFERRKGD
jgi:catechol 2,3-dioxygenase-like lactoylglutathione lyase family enzyme